MIIQLENGPVIGYHKFTFPDGQPHIELAREINFSRVNIQTSIMNPNDLFDLLMVKEILGAQQNNEVTLDLRYLMGGRMDKRTSINEPMTLDLVCGIIRRLGWKSIKVFDPHSEVTTSLLDAEAYYPDKELEKVLHTVLGLHRDGKNTMLVSPDAGAARKLDTRLDSAGISRTKFPRVRAEKEREQSTGEIISYEIMEATLPSIRDKYCLIIDDLCDGGRTFIECAKILNNAGALAVDLFVTHGLFTKPLPLPGIHQIYTTNSTHGAVLRAMSYKCIEIVGEE